MMKNKLATLSGKFRLAVMAMIAMLFAFMSASSQAAYGTNITDIVTDATSLFASVQTLVVVILAFGIGVWVINKLRRR
jgi:uncharacterized membrane protein YqjE